MSEKIIKDLSLSERLHSETARISWHELQRFFAKGSVLQVADTLDLVQVAAWFAEDNTDKLEPHIAEGEVAAPSNEQAKAWYKHDAYLWSVVVAPFVLVQERIATEDLVLKK